MVSQLYQEHYSYVRTLLKIKMLMAVTYSIQLRMSPTLFERGKNLSINKEFDVLDFTVTVQI